MVIKEYPFSGIYIMHWDGANPYFYFGQSIDMRLRVKQHNRNLKKNRHENIKLQNIYNKYGIPHYTFTIFCPPAQLNKREQRCIDLWFSDKGCCNISRNAEGNHLYTLSKKARERISIRKTNTFLSKEHKENISLGLLRAFQTGRKQPKFFGVDNHFFNQKHTDKTREKMKKPKNIGVNNIRARLVLDLQTGIYYDYAGEAAVAKGITLSTIYKKLSGYRDNDTNLIYV